MWRRPLQLLCVALGLGLVAAPAMGANVDQASQSAGPRVLSKPEFQAVAIEGLKSANGITRERAASRFAEIMEAAENFPGESKLARRVRTGHKHYENSRNIRKKHVATILGLFTTAQVAGISRKEAEGVLAGWPEG
jgi:hypothetical protein